MKKLTPEVLRWIAAGFFAVSALVFLPSLASGLMLSAAILTAPLPGLDEMIREKFHLKKPARIAIVTIVFFSAAMMTPAAETSRANTPAGLHRGGAAGQRCQLKHTEERRKCPCRRTAETSIRLPGKRRG